MYMGWSLDTFFWYEDWFVEFTLFSRIRRYLTSRWFRVPIGECLYLSTYSYVFEYRQINIGRRRKLVYFLAIRIVDNSSDDNYHSWLINFTCGLCKRGIFHLLYWFRVQCRVISTSHLYRLVFSVRIGLIMITSLCPYFTRPMDRYECVLCYEGN